MRVRRLRPALQGPTSHRHPTQTSSPYLDFEYVAGYAANYTRMVAPRPRHPHWPHGRPPTPMPPKRNGTTSATSAAWASHPADDPAECRRRQVRSWDSSGFTNPASMLMGTALENSVGFGQFVAAPTGALQPFYRSGNANNGTVNRAEYPVNGTTGTQTKMGTFTGVTGTSTAPNENTAADPMTRSLVPHGFNYAPNARLHVLGTWRESVSNGVRCYDTGKPVHNTVYVFFRRWRPELKSPRSRQLGKTWVGATTGRALRRRRLRRHRHLRPRQRARQLRVPTITSTGVPMALIYARTTVPSCVTDYTAQRTQYAKTYLIRRSASSSTIWCKPEIPCLMGDPRALAAGS
ncbi:uncharacterized protein EV422DRAFT_568854 [Fimicolochytrium jonesii]|uniref:uncharacterized protein n=1 Tax=Fimicolochytrium jonesii TaxID=1396493 RepID=UPI0022FE5347|nr:uncharacterized protein EV422DRAFT_568854 [Fimicolochytrium jonesii]KAI8819426.1 hypothetical protein EV422DRAFT_568854 [Fimicolochytrium jonesii]